MIDYSKSYIFYYKTNQEFINEQNVNPGEGVQSIVPGVSWTVESDVVDYNPPPAKTVVLTYVNRNGGGTTADTKTEHTYGDVSFTAQTAPEAWSEHTFLGWSTKEWPTYAETQTEGFLKSPGTAMHYSGDTTLYAVYSTTFQGLINEDYVRLGASDPNQDNNVRVLPNGYPKELVVDFQNVFNNDPDKLILRQSATYGIVGSGTVKNIFSFSSSTSNWATTYWLTPDEWYALYNGVQLKHYPASLQFKGMDWHDKGEVTIIYNGGNSQWTAADSAFGNKMPTVLNVTLSGNAQWQYMYRTYGSSNANGGCSSQIINLATTNGGKATAYRRPSGNNQGFQALFEGASNLREVHGLTAAGGPGGEVTNFAYMFDGSHSIQTLSVSDFDSVWRPKLMKQMFSNCWALQTIEIELMVSACTECNSCFRNASNLVNLKLKGINADTNAQTGSGDYVQSYTWELSDTKLNQTSANYIVSNVTTPTGSSVKTINFPSTVSLTSAQIAALRAAHWTPYINGVEQTS